VLSSHSSDPDVWDPIGKTPEELQHGARNTSAVTEERWPAPSPVNCRYIARAQNLAYTDELFAAIRAMAASVSILQTLAHKLSKGYAQHLAAGGANTTSSEEEQGTVLNETRVQPASSIRASLY
jgi:hypothetical protein